MRNDNGDPHGVLPAFLGRQPVVEPGTATRTCTARPERRLQARRILPPPVGAYAAPKGYSVMSKVDVRVAAGAGAWNGELEEVKGPWLFADPPIHHEFRARPDEL